MPQNIMRHEEEHLYAAPPRSEAGRALSIALLRLRRAQAAREARVLQASGLLNLDLRALRYLVQAERDERSIGPKDLIMMLATSSANVTKVVDRLVQKGMVERVQHPTDRRARYLRPTEAAASRVDAAVGDHHATLVAEIDEIDDVQAAIAAEVVERIAAALNEPVTPGGAATA